MIQVDPLNTSLNSSYSNLDIELIKKPVSHLVKVHRGIRPNQFRQCFFGGDMNLSRAISYRGGRRVQNAEGTNVASIVLNSPIRHHASASSPVDVPAVMLLAISCRKRSS